MTLHWTPYCEDSGSFAELEGMCLEAFDDGEWYVYHGEVTDKGDLILSHHNQVKGKDQQEARQRATAAALSYGQWLIQYQQDHGVN